MIQIFFCWLECMQHVFSSKFCWAVPCFVLRTWVSLHRSLCVFLYPACKVLLFDDLALLLLQKYKWAANIVDRKIWKWYGKKVNWGCSFPCFNLRFIKCSGVLSNYVAGCRYVMDSESQLRTVLEDHVDVADRSQTREDGAQVDWIPYFLKDFVLPAGFPGWELSTLFIFLPFLMVVFPSFAFIYLPNYLGSVSEDYLDYMLLQFPTNVTGWICHTLVASSLLKVD